MKTLIAGCVGLTFVLGIVRASALGDTIPGLYNTGVADDGSLLADGAVDPHYTLSGSGYGPNAFVVYCGAWLANGPASKWIGPQVPIEEAFCPEGTYDYRTTFDLTGFDTATAVINGIWSTDNLGTDILINGASTGFTNSVQFVAFTPFTISSGFVPGLNTLAYAWRRRKRVGFG